MQKNLSEQVNADMSLTMIWLEDTLQPSIDLMRLKSLIYDMEADIKIFEELHGKSDKTKRSGDRVQSAISLVEKLDKVANQNNTFQLIARHSDFEMIKVKQENQQLKAELEAVKKAWEKL